MDDSVKQRFEQEPPAFIKVTDSPLPNLSAEQKVILNRKGNELFNNGKFDDARRLFIATGYSDGLTRLGDEEIKKNHELDALKLYYLAHNKRKSEPLVEKVSNLISMLLDDKDEK